MMGLIFLFYGILYMLMLSVLCSQWQTVTDIPRKAVGSTSMVIPFRNEGKNLPRIFDSIKSASADEVIFCNDHSEDNSVSLIQDYKLRNRLVSWKIINNEGEGKKAAITTAVKCSSNQYVFTTDADCIVPPYWVKLVMAAFEDPKVNMVCGGVSVTEGMSLLEIFQKAEWASIVLVSQFFFKIKRPLMCSAANMAYRRSVFLEIGGYKDNDKISSGDDEFLLKKIYVTYGSNSVVYLNNPATVVNTFPTQDLTKYIAQRARWAGKWKAHKEWYHAGTAIFFLILAVLQLATFLLLFGDWKDIVVFFAFWVSKGVTDYLIINKVLKDYNKEISGLYLIFTSVLHPLSVIAIVVSSIFVKNYWKGRPVITKR